jgi:hypothetical protein
MSRRLWGFGTVRLLAKLYTCYRLSASGSLPSVELYQFTTHAHTHTHYITQFELHPDMCLELLRPNAIS